MTSLFLQVLVTAVLGVLTGVYAPDFAKGLEIFSDGSDGFLEMVTMIVAPVVFCVAVHGIASAGT